MPSDITAETKSSELPATTNLHYRPHLDGVRTIAVYLVVAFHAGLGLVAGGFIGVDIFFVLSGYLVTSILVRDLTSTGHIRRQQFYARRVRRILPAAVATLLGTAVVYSIVASPAEVLDALGGFRAAFLYVANWYFIRQSTNYFAANVNSNPVLQFWSLAVEEQFYLVWPLLFGGLYLLTRRMLRWQWWLIRAVVVAVGAASMIAALRLTETNLARAYYGTDTRAYQLLAGAALALTPQLLHLSPRWVRLARWTAVVALAALVALATSAFDLGPITRGVFVTALAVALLVALENAAGGAIKWMLSTRPFTYLGRISYGVYLWHWPVIVIAAYRRSLPPIELFAISCVVATALAALSFLLLEHPIRMSRLLNRYKTPVIAVGFTASILLGVFAMPAMLDPGDNSVSAVLGGSGSPSGPRLLDWRVARYDYSDPSDCLGAPVQRCTVVTGKGLRVLLMGDSHAAMLVPTFSKIAKERSWSFSVAAFPTCAWERDLRVVYTRATECAAHAKDWYERVIPELDPDLIILMHRSFDSPDQPLQFFLPNGHSAIRPGTPGFEPFLRQAASDSLKLLRRPGRKIVIIEPVPEAHPGDNPISCLSLGRAPGSCAFTAHRRPTPLEQFYRRLARPPGLTVLDIDRVVCPSWPKCDAVVGNVITRIDTEHLTRTYARSLADRVGALLPG
ncbi:MAG: acyltransferase family protein [Acidimicrobiia bacterium]